MKHHYFFVLILFFVSSKLSTNNEKQSWDGTFYKENNYFQNKGGRAYLDALSLTTFKRICDLGCGTGNLTAYIAQKTPESTVIGVDPDESMLKEAQAYVACYSNLFFIKSYAEEFRYQESFDLIFCNAVFHWVNNQQEALNLQYKNLSPNGELHIIMSGQLSDDYPIYRALTKTTQSDKWFAYFQKYKGQKLYNTCTMAEMEMMLHQAGFTDCALKEIYTKRRFQDFDSCKNWFKGFAGGTRGICDMSSKDQDAFLHDLVEQLTFESSTIANNTICADSKVLVVVAKK